MCDWEREEPDCLPIPEAFGKMWVYDSGGGLAKVQRITLLLKMCNVLLRQVNVLKLTIHSTMIALMMIIHLLMMIIRPMIKYIKKEPTMEGRRTVEHNVMTS